MGRWSLMGHERIGFLPHTRQWNYIVDSLALYGTGKTSAASIAEYTLEAVTKTYAKMPYDDSVVKALSFLATLSYSANQENQVLFLNNNGYSVDSNMSLVSILASVQRYVVTDRDSLEINKIARDATMQAIIRYQKAHETNQLTLFSDQGESIWKGVGSGAAFCEMARSFFASFTERQIKYYIERAAASSIDDYDSLQLFTYQLNEHTKAIADHAFEVSKLTESFAAGWFNKNVKDSLPTTQQVEGFLGHAFGKLREEFRREASGQ